MWRLIKVVPRVVRNGPWGSTRPAPQVVSRDDTEDTQIQPYHTNSSHDQKQQEQREETGADREWFRQFLGQQHTAMEAVGWSTALVLGVQLSHLWHFYIHRGIPQPDLSACPNLYYLATAMPIDFNRGTLIKSILPTPVSAPTVLPAPVPAPAESSTPDSAPEKDKPAKHVRFKRQAKAQRETRSVLDDLVFPTVTPFQSISSTRSSYDPPSLSTPLCTSEPPSTSTHDPSQPAPPSHCSNSPIPSTDSPIPRSDSPTPRSDSPIPCSDSPIPGFEEEWTKLCTEYLGMQGNREGKRLAKIGDLTAAFRHWKRVGEETGYAKARYNAALCYEMGRGTERDINKAASQYQAAAESGHSDAAYNLAVLYLTDQLTDGKYSAQEQWQQGAEWMKRAAKDTKDGSALFHLGVCYSHGIGVVADEDQALQYYEQASKHNHPEAQYTMGEVLAKRSDKDKQEALDYFQKAKENGYKAAEAKVQQLQEEIHQQKFDEFVERLSGMEDGSPDSPIRLSQSSPTLSQCLKRHLLEINLNEWDSGFSSPTENSMENPVTQSIVWKDLSEKSAKNAPSKSLADNHASFGIECILENSTETSSIQTKVGNAKLEVASPVKTKEKLKKSQSASSISSFNLQLLLGTEVAVKVGEGRVESDTESDGSSGKAWFHIGEISGAENHDDSLAIGAFGDMSFMKKSKVEGRSARV